VDAVAVIDRLGLDDQGLVCAADLRAAGVSTRDIAAAGSDVVKVLRAVYATAPLPAWPRYVVTDTGASPAYVVRVRAALKSLGPQAVACGRTAAVLRGWALLVEPGRTIEVAVPHGRSHFARPGVKVSQRRHLERVAISHDDATALNVTSAVQTAIDCCLLLCQREAVVVVDSALRSKQVRLDQLRAAAAALPGVRDAARVRRMLALCDPRSGSVLESVLRLAMVLDGIEGFLTQRVVRDARRSSAVRVDFCFEAARLVIEVDGKKWHPEPARDQQRDNGLARLGYRVLRYTWSDVVHEGGRVLAEIREALTAPQCLHLDDPAAARDVVAA
jgi:very-short-patch-repair endonuclease